MRLLAWVEPFWVALVGVALLMPPRFLPASLQPYLASWQPYGVALLGLGWPVRLLAYRRLFRRTPLDWPLLLIIFWLPVAYWASADKGLSWGAIISLAVGLALYFALIDWPPAQDHPEIIAWALLALGAALSATAPLLGDLTGKKLLPLAPLAPLLARLGDLTPGAANANRIAGAIVVLLPLPAALALYGGWSRRRWPRLLCALLALANLAVLALTQSRGGYMAGAAALALLLILRWPRLIYALPLVALGIGFAVYRVGLAAITDLFSAETVMGGLDGRLELWSRALYAISDFPFTGIGIGTFERVIPLLYPYFLISPDNVITHAHNLLLQVAVDLGIPGLIAFLALYLNACAIAAQALRRPDLPLARALAAGSLGSFLALFVHGLVDAAIWGARTGPLPWVIVALAVQVGLQAIAPSPNEEDVFLEDAIYALEWEGAGQ